MAVHPRRASLAKGIPRAPLPLNPDGAAPERDEGEAGPITMPLMWRTPDRTASAIDYNYRNMAIRVDTRGLACVARYDSPICSLCPVFRARISSNAGHPIRAGLSSGRAFGLVTSPTCWGSTRACTDEQ